MKISRFHLMREPIFYLAIMHRERPISWEAAYLSGTTKSHKGSKDKEMIRFGTNEAHLRTMVLKNGKQYQIDMHLKHNRSKGIAVNKIPMKKQVSFLEF